MTSKTLLIPALIPALISSLLLAPALASSAPAIRHDSALFGTPARLETVTRTIDITPGTTYITVASGESVAFRAGGQTVGWTFLEAINGTTTRLSLLMPGVAQASNVYVHVAPSEVYHAG